MRKLIRALGTLLVIAFLFLCACSECHRYNTRIHGYEIKEF